jgi:hypothetical protein
VPATVKPKPKRILRVRLDSLPKLPDIPVVGSIGQPIDSLDYMFVSAGTSAVGAVMPGLTRTELADINLVSTSICDCEARMLFLFLGANSH